MRTRDRTLPFAASRAQSNSLTSIWDSASKYLGGDISPLSLILPGSAAERLNKFRRPLVEDSCIYENVYLWEVG